MEQQYNERHIAVRYQHEQLAIGAYLNSMDRVSLYGAYEFRHESLWAEVGIVSGYAIEVAPLVRIGLDFNESTSLSLAPAFELQGEQMRVGAVLVLEQRF